ncbi:MAG: hypothetical protein Q8807_02210 ['Waltheria sp.' little leaf phytoplasma]|nr:hypothetical protein ['Waltheria sp.' little leaf phytoplasma]
MPQLKGMGTTATQLRNSCFSVYRLKQVGYTLLDVIVADYDTEDIRVQFMSINDLYFDYFKNNLFSDKVIPDDFRKLFHCVYDV